MQQVLEREREETGKKKKERGEVREGEGEGEGERNNLIEYSKQSVSPFKSIVELDIRSILQSFLSYLDNFFVIFLFCFPLICDRDREDKPSNRSRGPRENRHRSLPPSPFSLRCSLLPSPFSSLLPHFSSCPLLLPASHILFRLHDSTICPQLAVLCCHNIFQKIQCMLFSFLYYLSFSSPLPSLSLPSLFFSLLFITAKAIGDLYPSYSSCCFVSGDGKQTCIVILSLLSSPSLLRFKI